VVGIRQVKAQFGLIVLSFDMLTCCTTALPASESAATEAAAEKTFEKITEPAVAEYLIERSRTIPTAASLLCPLRKIKPFATGMLVLLPVGTQLIVLCTLFIITQHFIGLRYLLEFLLGSLVVRISVGMVFLCQLTVFLFYLRFVRFFVHPQYFIIVFIFHNFKLLSNGQVVIKFCAKRKIGKYDVL
jgi:hypothetical protein